MCVCECVLLSREVYNFVLWCDVYLLSVFTFCTLDCYRWGYFSLLGLFLETHSLPFQVGLRRLPFQASLATPVLVLLSCSE